MTKLHIGEGLLLPLDAVTQKFAFLGRTGSGKTYAAGKLVEEMLGRHAQVIVIDPVGAWWGLRLAADGKAPGISIPVFGGLHGDVPLEVNSGKYMADLLVSHGTSAVLDVSQFESDADKVRFLEPFGNQLFFRKKQSPSAMHLVIEECQEVVPQNPMKGDEKMLHAYARIEKLGRNFGIGVSLISQRPQEVNKKALNQTECMFAFQMTAPQERKAIREWIQEKGLDVDIVDILPKLRQGQAHVWSPQWLEISAEYDIGQKQTFNASATPEVGKTAVRRELAPIDLERIRGEMAATIERAKAEDPKELRRKIAELERAVKAKPKAEAKDTGTANNAALKQIAKLRAALGEAMKVIVKINAEGFKDASLTPEEVSKALEAAAARVAQMAEQKVAAKQRALESLQREASGLNKRLQQLIGEGAAEEVEVAVSVSHQQPFAVKPNGHGVSKTRREVVMPPEGLSASHVKVLSRLVELLQCTGQDRVRKEQLAAWSEYSPNSGGFNNYLGTLRSAGLIDYPSPGYVTITAEGQKVSRPEDVPVDSSEILERAMRVLGGSEARILQMLHEIREEVGKSDLAEAVGFSPNSGGFNNYLGHMRTLGFIEYPQPGKVRVSDWLFI